MSELTRTYDIAAFSQENAAKETPSFGVDEIILAVKKREEQGAPLSEQEKRLVSFYLQTASKGLWEKMDRLYGDHRRSIVLVEHDIMRKPLSAVAPVVRGTRELARQLGNGAIAYLYWTMPPEMVQAFPKKEIVDLRRQLSKQIGCPPAKMRRMLALRWKKS